MSKGYRSKIFLGILIVVMLTVAACASFLKTNYRVLYMSKTTYYTAMQSVADLQEKGVITAEQRIEINKVAKIFKQTHNLYEDALEVYIKTDTAEAKEKVRVALAEAISKWQDVARLINAIKPGTVPDSIL